MDNVAKSLETLMETEGIMCCAIVDSTSGMVLGQAGSGVDMMLAAAGNTEVVRAKMKTMKALGLNDEIEDILITLGKQYHIIHPRGNLFLYAVLNRSKANLAMARYHAAQVAAQLSV